MKLYHYTGLEHVEGIRREGLTLGGIALPVMNPDGSCSYRLGRGYQWLTDLDDWAQSWATQNLTHCDRTEARFIIVIPKAHRNRLVSSDALMDTIYAQAGDHLAPGSREAWDEWEGHERWYVFAGRIPPSWIRGFERHPEHT